MSNIWITEDFIEAHSRFNRSGQNLGDVSFTCDRVSSESQALAAFQDRVEELMNTLKDYQFVLKADSAHLFGVAQTFDATDKGIASRYKNEVGNKL